MTPDAADIPELVRQAVDEVRTDDEYKRALVQLHEMASEQVCTAATSLCSSDDSDARRTGCRILAELGQGWGRPFASPAAVCLRALLRRETDSDVTAAALWALALQGISEDRATIRGYISHDSADVREVVASSVAGTYRPDEQQDVDARAALRTLVSDPDVEVRQSATWSLAYEMPLEWPFVRKLLAEIAARQNEDRMVVQFAREGLDGAYGEMTREERR